MHARDLMTPSPRVVTGRDTVAEAAALMRSNDIGFIPVVDDLAHMHPRGVLTDRDIAIRCVAERHSPDGPVEEFMTTGRLASVGPGASLDEILATMEEAQIRRILVIDGGRLVGVIAQADVALKEGRHEPLKVEELLERISAPAFT